MACLFLAGCSGANPPALPALPPLTAGAGTAAPVAEPPTEIYARIARGAMACWFGTAGPLKANYIYHAEADPPAQGGKAEIVIHERDPTSGDPRGLRAFRVTIMPAGEASTLTSENLKLPEPLGKSMEADVNRWAAGEIGCSQANAGEGWAPKPPEQLEDPAKKKPGAKTMKGRAT